MDIEVVYCANGNPRYPEIAKKYQMRIGAQLPGTIYDSHLDKDRRLFFADQDFKRPRYVGYIKALRRYRPYMASVLDIEEWRRLGEYLMRAEEISQYCDVVMLIPKVNGVIEELGRLFPDKKINGKAIRLGYSVPTRFGGTDVPKSEFEGWPVHLLGGSPLGQFELSSDFDTVSLDGNYAHLMAGYCQFFYPEFLWTEEYRERAKKRGKEREIRNPIWPTILEHDGKLWGDGSNTADAPYEAFERSCKNIMAMWRER